MNKDRNLLFGVLAVQLGRVSTAQLVEAAARWANDPSRDLGAHLVEAGGLSPTDRDAVERLVSRTIAGHDGDVTGQLEHPSIVPVHELGTRRDGHQGVRVPAEHLSGLQPLRCAW